jgi:4-hydroxybenzoate polyprenyltransferase
MQRTHQWIKQGIATLSSSSIPLPEAILAFLFTATIGQFLTGFTYIYQGFNLPDYTYFYYLLRFLAAASNLILLLSILIHQVARLAISQVLRYLLGIALIWWLIPLTNMLLGVHSQTIAATPGVKVMLLTLLAAIAIFLQANGLSKYRQGVILLLASGLCALWFYAAELLTYLNAVIPTLFAPTHQIMCYGNLLLLPLLALAVAYYYDRATTAALLNDLRFMRLLYFKLLLLTGFTLGLLVLPYSIYQQLTFMPLILYRLALSSYGLMFAALFAIITNNIADIEIDKVSNPSRPLLTQAITVSAYKQIAYCALCLSLSYAMLAGSNAFLCLATAMGIYYLYSMPPFRFKRIFLLSKLAISATSLIVFMLGFMLSLQGFYNFPTSLYIIFLIGFSLSANVIDLKDYAGDAKAGIKTLPVIVGLQPAKFLTGVAVLATYAAWYLFLHNLKLLPLQLGVGCLQFYLINRKTYTEAAVFAVNNISLMGLLLYLLYCSH